MGQRPHIIPVVALALALPGCPDPIPPPTDNLPPVNTARVSFSAGASVDLVDGQVLPVSTADVRIHLELDEPGTIQYTTNDTIPASANPETGVGYAPVSMLFDRDVVVRWFARDTAGNAEAKAHRVEVRFDRTPPEVTFSPPGGQYGGELAVEISTDEPATLFWTVDGRPPLPGATYAFEGPSPVTVDASGAMTLWVRAVDAAGNAVEVAPQEYDVDDAPPLTQAEPQGGHFLAPIPVDLVSSEPQVRIHYTTNGQDPDLDSPVWEGPMNVDGSLELRFRGVDIHGNVEAVRYAFFEIGPRALREPVMGDSARRFDVTGELALATALLRASGPLSGVAEWVSSGVDWTLWAAGRNISDAFTLQSGIGPHLMRSPGMVDVSMAGEGVPDVGLDGFNLDDTWRDRVDTLAAQVGVSAPNGLFPVSLPYQWGTATLSEAPSREATEEGTPAWTHDLAAVRWVNEGTDGRSVTPDTLAALVESAVARAWSATEGTHYSGDGPWAAGAGPVVGRRCGGCHGDDGVQPTLNSPGALTMAGIPDGGALGPWLTGQGTHPVDPATPGEVRRAAEWGGGPDPGDVSLAVGREGQDALSGLMALEQVNFALHHLWTSLIFDLDEARLGGGAGTMDSYLCGVVNVLEGSGSSGIPPHVQQLSVEDRTFFLGPQARLLNALLEYLGFVAARPALFADGPLAGSPALAGGPELAETLVAFQVLNLGQRVYRDTFLLDSWHPDSGQEDTVTAIDFADALVALRRAQTLGYTEPGVEVALASGRSHFERYFLRTDGDYTTRLSRAYGAEPGPRRLAVQLAVLRMLLLAGSEGGDLDALSAGEALWNRLNALWWDDAVGLWQSTLGLAEYRYTPALFARALEGARLAVAAGLPDAENRLQRVAAAFAGDGLLGETWLTGEVDGGADADGDGVPHFGSTGAAPVAAGEVIF